MKIAIIGAGITGLTAAHELSKKGHDVTVFERGKVPGGLGTFIPIAGTHLECFYHHFFESDAYIKRLASELGVEKSLKFYRAKTGIYYNKKIFPFSSAIDLLRFSPLPIIDRIRCGFMMGFLKIMPFPLSSLDAVPASDWTRRVGGKQTYNKIWKPLLQGKFSEHYADTPALWLWGRIRDRSPKLGYFDGSVKVLFDAMAKAIEKNGGKIKLGAEVAEIESEEKGVSLKVGARKQAFDKVISTTVSPITALLLKSSLNKKDRDELSAHDHLGSICVVVELKQQVQSQYWLSICDKNAPVLAMIEHTNFISPKVYKGTSIVYLANYIHRDDKRFKMTDEKIIEEYTGFLKKLNKNFDESWIIKTRVFRVPRTQTIFKLFSLKSRPPVKLPVPNVYMVNIDQMYPHDRNLNQGVELGKKVARIVLQPLKK